MCMVLCQRQRRTFASTSVPSGRAIGATVSTPSQVLLRCTRWASDTSARALSSLPQPTLAIASAGRERSRSKSNTPPMAPNRCPKGHTRQGSVCVNKATKMPLGSVKYEKQQGRAPVSVPAPKKNRLISDEAWLFNSPGLHYHAKHQTQVYSARRGNQLVLSMNPIKAPTTYRIRRR